MKPETLKLKPEFIGKAIYEGSEKGPARMGDTAGSYMRHSLFNEEHGKFHVITLASSKVVPKGAWVEVVEPKLHVDYGVNGRNVEPARNVWAKELVVVK